MIATHPLSPSRDQRGTDRIDLERNGTARDPQQQPIDVIVEDLSAGGCRLHSAVKLPVNRILNLGIPGVGRREGRVVWETAPKHGIQFLWPLTSDEVAASRTAESLVLGAFPQRLDLSCPADAEGERPPRLAGALRLGVIAAASLSLWVAGGIGIARLLG